MQPSIPSIDVTHPINAHDGRLENVAGFGPKRPAGVRDSLAHYTALYSGREEECERHYAAARRERAVAAAS